MTQLVGVVQAGFGNSTTIRSMLRIAGFQCEEVFNPRRLQDFSHVILPGVGHWSRGSQLLSTGGWSAAIKELAANQVPILGVCLGMQLLGVGSEEGEGPGLSLIDMEARSIGGDARTTNVGWKRITGSHGTNTLTNGGPYYFTHSFAVNSSGRPFEVAHIQEQSKIVALVNSANVWGAQFHPERSNSNGSDFLKAFVEGTLR